MNLTKNNFSLINAQKSFKDLKNSVLCKLPSLNYDYNLTILLALIFFLNRGTGHRLNVMVYQNFFFLRRKILAGVEKFSQQ